MKTFVFAAVAMALVSSCTSSEIDEIVNENNELVAIQLSAGVQANVVAGTRAALTGSATFKPTILGWEGTDVPNYATTEANWTATTTNDILCDGTNTALALDAFQYYNANGAVKTYMKAFYPAGTVTTGAYSFDSPDKDGTLDVLVSDVVIGDKKDADNKKFTFAHPLTQLTFAAEAGDGWRGGTVKSITLKGASVATGINIADGALVTESVSEISVGLDANNKEITAKGGVVTVTTPVMIAPVVANAISIDIVMTDNTAFKGVLVTTDGDTFAAGKAYTITLTFQNKQIAGNASVTGWDATGIGSGTVE